MKRWKGIVMKSDSLKENIIYQGLYQLIRTMTPLITIPIISRAFGPSGVGIVSFSFNIVQYRAILFDDCKCWRSVIF